MLKCEDKWVWDSWYVDDGDVFHAFFLQAPRSLIDPNDRHLNASIGHAVSRDLYTWEYLGTALSPSRDGFDNQAVWTGSIVQDANGLWHLFYTGINKDDLSFVQRIGHATSRDLMKWDRNSYPVAEADPRWYQQRNDVSPPDQPFRDPWVFHFDDRWHMVATANLRNGIHNRCATMAHLVSHDLYMWEPQEPLIQENSYLRQMEVFQIEKINGKYVALFCMGQLDVFRPDVTPMTATYWMPADSPLGPFHIEKAKPIEDQIYAARLVRDRNEQWNILGFKNEESDGTFGGYICDPIPFG